jgi:hypothetical protein
MNDWQSSQPARAGSSAIQLVPNFKSFAAISAGATTETPAGWSTLLRSIRLELGEARRDLPERVAKIRGIETKFVWVRSSQRIQKLPPARGVACLAKPLIADATDDKLRT